MVQKVAHGDTISIGRQLGDVFPDTVVQRDDAVLDQKQDREGGELLGGRGNVEEARGIEPSACRKIRQSVAVGIEQFLPPVDADGIAGPGVVYAVLGEQRINAGFEPRYFRHATHQR